jgi:hypothetical protein
MTNLTKLGDELRINASNRRHVGSVCLVDACEVLPKERAGCRMKRGGEARHGEPVLGVQVRDDLDDASLLAPGRLCDGFVGAGCRLTDHRGDLPFGPWRVSRRIVARCRRGRLHRRRDAALTSDKTYPMLHRNASCLHGSPRRISVGDRVDRDARGAHDWGHVCSSCRHGA